jgi:glyoxylase-like metal-dependent hydrolase (beta-lactamase superfamily II)
LGNPTKGKILCSEPKPLKEISGKRQKAALCPSQRFLILDISTSHVRVRVGERQEIEISVQFEFTDSDILGVIHTPGHTSGSICIYEFNTKVLFSGDTVFAGGTLSYIAESGSVGDYIDSMMRLEARKITEIYPGHGAISKNPEQDLSQAILNAKKLLSGEEDFPVSPFRPPFESGVTLG